MIKTQAKQSGPPVKAKLLVNGPQAVERYPLVSQAVRNHGNRKMEASVYSEGGWRRRMEAEREDAHAHSFTDFTYSGGGRNVMSKSPISDHCLHTQSY